MWQSTMYMVYHTYKSVTKPALGAPVIMFYECENI